MLILLYPLTGIMILSGGGGGCDVGISNMKPPFHLLLQKEEISDKERWQHLADLADFALAMKVTLMNINYQSFNNFMLRIGEYLIYLF